MRRAVRVLAAFLLRPGLQPTADPCRKRRASSSGSEQEPTLKRQQLCDGAQGCPSFSVVEHMVHVSPCQTPLNCKSSSLGKAACLAVQQLLWGRQAYVRVVSCHTPVRHLGSSSVWTALAGRSACNTLAAPARGCL